MTDTLLLFSHVALWVLMTVVYAAVFLLYRYLGESVAARKARVEETQAQGPSLGARAPSLEIQSIDGSSLRLDKPSDRQRLVMFVAPHCGGCRQVLPRLRSLADARHDEIETILVFHGDEAGAERYARQLTNSLTVVADRETNLARLWRCHVTPFAVVLDRQGIVQKKGIANTEAVLDTLFAPLGNENDSLVSMEVPGRTRRAEETGRLSLTE